MAFSIRPTRLHGELRVWVLSTGPLQQNCVVIADDSGQGFLIDPGDDAADILDFLQQADLHMQAILLTHGHFDHIGAVQPIRESLGIPVYMHPNDLPLYHMGAQSAARWNLPFAQPADPDQPIAQDQVFEAGKVSLRARELFGHAPGHVVFVAQGLPQDAAGLVIAGDTLFAGSIGRTDLPMGNHAQLIAGIQRELLPLPDNTYVYAGHGPVTTIEREKRSNPYLA